MGSATALRGEVAVASARGGTMAKALHAKAGADPAKPAVRTAGGDATDQ